MASGQEPTIASQTIYKGKVLSLRLDTIQFPQGRISQREIVEHSGSVAIVPLDSHGNVLMVRQYRKAVGRTLLEIPAGGMDEGEEPEACAHRELKEETGYTAKQMQRLAGFFTSPGFCNEEMHAFLATGLTAGQPRPEVDENIEVVPVPLRSVPQMIKDGAIWDAKSIASLLLVMENARGLT